MNLKLKIIIVFGILLICIFFSARAEAGTLYSQLDHSASVPISTATDPTEWASFIVDHDVAQVSGSYYINFGVSGNVYVRIKDGTGADVCGFNQAMTNPGGMTLVTFGGDCVMTASTTPYKFLSTSQNTPLTYETRGTSGGTPYLTIQDSLAETTTRFVSILPEPQSVEPDTSVQLFADIYFGNPEYQYDFLVHTPDKVCVDVQSLEPSQFGGFSSVTAGCQSIFTSGYSTLGWEFTLNDGLQQATFNFYDSVTDHMFLTPAYSTTTTFVVVASRFTQEQIAEIINNNVIPIPGNIAGTESAGLSFPGIDFPSSCIINFTSFDLGECIYALILPSADNFQFAVNQFISQFTTIFPFGYVTRTYQIINESETATSTLPSISFTAPSSFPFAAGLDLSIDPFSYGSSTSNLMGATDQDGDSFRDISETPWRIIVYLSFFLLVIFELLSLRKHDNQKNL